KGDAVGGGGAPATARPDGYRVAAPPYAGASVPRRDYHECVQRPAGRTLSHHLIEPEYHLGEPLGAAAGCRDDSCKLWRVGVRRATHGELGARAPGQCSGRQYRTGRESFAHQLSHRAATRAASVSLLELQSRSFARSPSTTAAGALLTKRSFASLARSDS